MAGYQTIEALRPILHRGPPATPVVSRDLVRRPEQATDKLRSYKPRNKHCPSAEQICEMIALRQKGVSTRAIGIQVGFVQSTVKRHVRHVVVPEHLKIRGRPREEYDVALVERMWHEGATYGAIAKVVGANKSAIYYRLNGYPPGRPPEAYRKRAYREWKRVTPEEVVSRITGFSVSELISPAAPVSGASRARVILQWLMRHKQPDRPYAEIARACGLTDHTSSINAFNRVERIITALKINTRGSAALVVRKIWDAEWPKASA